MSHQQTTQLDPVTLQYQDDRLRETQQVEHDMVNLQAIHHELNSLVHMQANQIDSLDAHIDEADVKVEEGVQELEKAAEYAVGSRKKKIILAIILSIVLIIALVFLFNFLYSFIQMGKAVTGIILVVAIVLVLAIAGYFIKEKVQNGSFGFSPVTAATTAVATAGTVV